MNGVGGRWLWGTAGGDLAQFDAVRLYYGPEGDGAGGLGDMVLEADLP